MAGFDIIGIQEHRLSGEESVLQARHSLERLGWRSLLKQARMTQMSTSGGVGLVFAPWVSARIVPGFEALSWVEVFEVQVGGLPPWHVAVVYGSQDTEENLCNAGWLVCSGGQGKGLAGYG